MSLSSFWEQEKDLTFGVFNHFTSKHFTHIPWFVSTSSALLHKKASSEQIGWARSLLTGAMQGRSPHLTLQRHPWVLLPFQQDPSDQWNTACTPWLLPSAKAVKERARFCLISSQWQCNSASLRGKNPQCQISSPWCIFDSALISLYWVFTRHRNYLEYPGNPVNKLVLRFWLLLWQSKARRQAAKRS